MSFYEVTPLGYILSFFAKHLYNVDEVLPDTGLQVLGFFPLVVGVLIIICVYVPWICIAVPFLIAIWLASIYIFVSVQNHFQELENENKAPMLAHISNTLEGLFSIRLYKAQEKFDYFNHLLIDADHKALYSLLLGISYLTL